MVIAQPGSQAPMQHQAGLLLLATACRTYHEGLLCRRACITGLDFSAAHIPWPARAPLCCVGMIAPFTLECSTDARAMACPCYFPGLRACIRTSASPPTHTHTHTRHHALLLRTAAKPTLPQKWCYGALFIRCASRCTVGQWRRSLPAGLASQPSQPTNFHAHRQDIVWVLASKVAPLEMPCPSCT